MTLLVKIILSTILCRRRITYLDNFFLIGRIRIFPKELSDILVYQISYMCRPLISSYRFNWVQCYMCAAFFSKFVQSNQHIYSLFHSIPFHSIPILAPSNSRHRYFPNHSQTDNPAIKTANCLPIRFPRFTIWICIDIHTPSVRVIYLVK